MALPRSPVLLLLCIAEGALSATTWSRSFSGQPSNVSLQRSYAANTTPTLGFQVSMADDTFVAGAYKDTIDLSGSAAKEAGSIYIYHQDGGNWVEQSNKFSADAAVGDHFGAAVSIFTDTIAIGAPRAESASPTLASAGAVYVLSDNATWSEPFTKLQPSDPSASALFGYSVAGAGEYLVAGSPFDDDLGQNAGAAYVFVGFSGTWLNQHKLKPQSGQVASDANTGMAVAIAGDYVALGAPNDAEGSVFTFLRSGVQGSDVWAQQSKVASNDLASGDQFGFSVALQGEYLAVGAPKQDGAAGTGCGSAYVFHFSSYSGWALQSKITASDPKAGNMFGHSVTIAGADSVGSPTYVVVGAPYKGTGAVYVFEQNGSAWTQQTKLAGDASGDRFGASVCATVQSNSSARLVVGAPGALSGAGKVYAFAGDSTANATTTTAVASAPTSAPTAAVASAPTSAPTAAVASAPTSAPTAAVASAPTSAPTAAVTMVLRFSGISAAQFGSVAQAIVVNVTATLLSVPQSYIIFASVADEASARRANSVMVQLSCWLPGSVKHQAIMSGSVGAAEFQQSFSTVLGISVQYSYVGSSVAPTPGPTVTPTEAPTNELATGAAKTATTAVVASTVASSAATSAVATSVISGVTGSSVSGAAGASAATSSAASGAGAATSAGGSASADSLATIFGVQGNRAFVGAFEFKLCHAGLVLFGQISSIQDTGAVPGTHTAPGPAV